MSAKTTIGQDEVQHMATLSRLSVSVEEQQMFAKQFADILDYMDTLQHVDVTNVEPLYSPVSHTCVPRADTSHNLRSRAEILQNAPLADGQYFMVPKIV